MESLATVRDNKAGWQGKKGYGGDTGPGVGRKTRSPMEIWEQSFRESHNFSNIGHPRSKRFRNFSNLIFKNENQKLGPICIQLYTVDRLPITFIKKVFIWLLINLSLSFIL